MEHRSHLRSRWLSRQYTSPLPDGGMASRLVQVLAAGGGMADLRVTTIRERPDLVPIVTGWLWAEWWKHHGFSLEQTQALVAGSVSAVGVPQAFVLLEDGLPVGTATLAASDLDERPDLTPWLAGVIVVPERRGRGHVCYLLDAFEDACRAASITVAWLYTRTAERIYRRAGWETVELVHRVGKEPVVLMRRTLLA